ncbi:MAG: urea ABC transporter ATP-binding protein UrtD [Oscillospiraceae bacterium]|nr:urea ABC transporter ATP-binding protein UrtD [Oscillospiraceae bacterium]
MGVATPVLEIKNASITFGNFRAVKNVSTTVYENEVRFLIGPNGAGKTTLLDAICGKNKLSDGNIIYHNEGEEYDLQKIKENKIVNIGVGRKFQAPSVFTGLTIFENMELAVVRERDVFSSLRSRLKKREIEDIKHQLQFVGLYEMKDEYPTVLSHGQKQWLEIAMLCVSKPKLMLLDEPVAGMGRRETQRTAELLRIIQNNCTIIVVEHDMQFVKEVATLVTVLHDGELLCEGTMDEVSSNQQVIDVYLGRGGE